MKKRAASTAKSMAKGKSKVHGTFFSSPISVPSPAPSSKPYDFDIPSFPTPTAAAACLHTSPAGAAFSRHHQSPPPSSKIKTTVLASISDLKAVASSRIDSLKRQCDVCHSDILTTFEASHTRLSKRIKLQTKACFELTEEAEKDYKKIADRINEHTEIMKASYGELISEAHSTATRVQGQLIAESEATKAILARQTDVSIPELMQSTEKAIVDLRSRYKVPATPM